MQYLSYADLHVRQLLISLKKKKKLQVNDDKIKIKKYKIPHNLIAYTLLKFVPFHEIDTYISYFDVTPAQHANIRYKIYNSRLISTVTAQGTIEFRIDGRLHRCDGPAVIHANGSQFWYYDGQIHRCDGPAIEYANGDLYWYQHNLRHRLKGPAITHANGAECYYINGVLQPFQLSDEMMELIDSYLKKEKIKKAVSNRQLSVIIIAGLTSNMPLDLFKRVLNIVGTSCVVTEYESIKKYLKYSDKTLHIIDYLGRKLLDYVKFTNDERILDYLMYKAIIFGPEILLVALIDRYNNLNKAALAKFHSYIIDIFSTHVIELFNKHDKSFVVETKLTADQLQQYKYLLRIWHDSLAHYYM